MNEYSIHGVELTLVTWKTEFTPREMLSKTWNEMFMSCFAVYPTAV